MWQPLRDLDPEARAKLERILSRKPPSSFPNCGTHSGFARHRDNGERACDPCAEAHNEYQRARIQRVKQFGTKPRPKARHGTPHMYKHHGCRCAPCVEAYRKYHREFYKARRQRVSA